MEAEKGTFFKLRVGEWRRQAATVRDSRRQFGDSSATVGDSRRQAATGGDSLRQFGDSRRQAATGGDSRRQAESGNVRKVKGRQRH